MKLAGKLLDHILFGNIYVAAGAAFLVQSTRIQLGYTDLLLPYSLLVFFATLFIYNFQRIFYSPKKDVSLHSVRRRWIFTHQKVIRILAAIGFAGVAVTFFFNTWKIILYLAPLLALSVAYFAPMIRLRQSPWFKLLTLVGVWTVVTAVVPVLLGPEEFFLPAHMLHIFIRFCFMMGICIPFDIRDLEIDKADNVLTLPHILGQRRTTWLAVIFMFLYILLCIPEFAMGMFDSAVFLALLLSAAINAVLVFMSNAKRNEYFYVAGIDGTMILQGAFLLIATLIR